MNSIKELKVIELASVLAGPLVGSFFAEAGAKVIKYEKPGGGDLTRSWKNNNENLDGASSSYFASANYGKEFRVLDLNNSDDIEKLYKELQSTDILLSNFKEGDAERFHLETEKLSKRFPKLIQGQIESFSQTPQRTAFDIVLQGETGYLSMTGQDKEHLAKLPIAAIDVLASHQLKEGILIALLNRTQTGKGALVKVSLYDSAISALGNQASAWLMDQLAAQPLGTLHPSIAPYGEIIECADKLRLILAIGNDGHFLHLCQSLRQETLAHDKRFEHNVGRVHNRQALLKLLQNAAESFSGMDLFEDLVSKRVPVGRIRTIDEVFTDAAAQALILEEVQEGKQTRRVATNVFRIHDNL